MHTPSPYLRLAAFAGAVCLLSAGAAVAGGVTKPHGSNPTPPAEASMKMSHSADAVRGLAVSDHGLRLVVAQPELRRGRTETLRFRIADRGGRTVSGFDVEHTKRMHLIVARRDLTHFQHLHPTQAADGSWSVRVRLGAAGSYRMFADFSHDGTPRTLAADLRVDGAADLRPLPAPSPTAVSDGGYDVRLDVSGSKLRFAITHDGVAVRPEPYLGAAGHLVALREGDMAFLHVHPTGPGAKPGSLLPSGGAGPSFEAEFPTAGRYRLFLQFKHEGRVQTVAFTREVS